MSTTTEPTDLAHAAVAAQAWSAVGSVRPAETGREWHDATTIVREHAAWVEAVAGITMTSAQPAFASELHDLRATYGSEHAVLLIAEDHTGVAGIVAVRRHDDGTAELKRMYVRPAARGRGHACRLVCEAIAHAAAWRASSVWLETLPGAMDTAIALYERHGFRHAGRAPHIDLESAILMVRDLSGAANP